MSGRIWVTTFPRRQGRIYLGCNCGWRHDTGEGMPSLASINKAALAHSFTCELPGGGLPKASEVVGGFEDTRSSATGPVMAPPETSRTPTDPPSGCDCGRLNHPDGGHRVGCPLNPTTRDSQERDA